MTNLPRSTVKSIRLTCNTFANGEHVVKDITQLADELTSLRATISGLQGGPVRVYSS